MNNNMLITINENEGKQTVSGRELHKFLESKERYSKWFDRMLEYGFSKGVDYTPYFLVHPQNNQELQDHELTISMAKEISMLQRSEKGGQARKYFIACEEAWQSPEAIMARALQISKNKLIEVQTICDKQQKLLEEQKPKVIFAEAVEGSTTSITIGQLAKLMSQKGVKIGRNKLFETLRQRGYLIKAEGRDYNLPTQKSMNLGLFEIKETTATNWFGHTIINRTVLVTGKGQLYFINKALKNK